MTAWFTEHFPNVVALGLHGDTGWVTSIIETLFMVFGQGFWWASWTGIWCRSCCD